MRRFYYVDIANADEPEIKKELEKVSYSRSLGHYEPSARFLTGVKQAQGKRKKKGLIFEYEETYYYFCKGYIPAKKNGKWGVIDTHGNTVVSFAYNMINATSSKFLIVQNETGWGIVDCSTGKEVVPCKYDEVGYPNTTLMYCSVKNKGNEGYADFYGNDTL